MPGRISSVFGSYDFFGKSLPGISLVLGLTPLLPKDSIPRPTIPENLFAFIVLFAAIVLIGTLLGEVVHTITIYFETLFAWVGRRFLNTIRLIKDFCGQDAKESQAQFTRLRNHEDPPSEGLVEGWKFNIRKWFRSRFYDIVAILLSHRKLFQLRIESYLEFPNPGVGQTTTEVRLTHRNLLDKVRKDIIEVEKDVTDIYPIIVTALSNEDQSRAFKFQARYAFCRGMWIVLFILAFIYWLILGDIVNWTPKAMQYQSYISSHSPNVIGMISFIILFLSSLFAFASGKYKNLYLDYLMVEFYVLYKEVNLR